MPRSTETIDDKIREVNKPKLLILDELGFIPFTPLQGQLLFELISARYEKKSINVTSNKMPGEWGTVFGDAAAATASLDRLLHHCTPMLISGEHGIQMEKALTEAGIEHTVVMFPNCDHMGSTNAECGNVYRAKYTEMVKKYFGY